MRTLVKLVKASMVERVSNADRARYALRASPNARQQKDQTVTISLQEKKGAPSRVGQIRTSLRPPSLASEQNLLTWRQPVKIIVAIGKNS
jgi:hypothetical protein